jgi:SAM-dependent methyltransferase
VTLEIVQADAVQLPLAAGSVDVVVALGLLPWVNDPAAVLAECSRVLVPGGSLIVSADNRWRLVEFLDPKLSPFANPLRRAVGPLVRAMRGRQSAEFAVHRHSPDELRRLLVAAGLHPGSIETVGYGPVMLMRKPILEGAAGLKLARGLSFAAGRFKPLAKLGVHVLAHATTQRDGEPPWP